MVPYLNTHIALEHRRDQAVQTKSSGPRVVLLGPHDVGKSTISHILVNWAVRRQRRPLYVDLDVGQGALAVPGVVGAALLDRPMDVTEGLATTTPLVYHYGHVSPEQNTALYKRLVSVLATRLEKRCVIDEKVRTSGYIVNTAGWVDGQGVQLLHHVIEALNADVVLVVDHERLYNELRAWAKTQRPTTTVLRLAKSGGVVTRTAEFRFAERSRQIRKYFYGVTTSMLISALSCTQSLRASQINPCPCVSMPAAEKDGRIVSSTLYPHVTQLRFDHVSFYKIGAPAVPLACLPLGVDPAANETKLTAVTPSEDLLHSILSVSAAPYARDMDETQRQGVVDASVAGFIYISEVNVKGHTLTALAPAPGPLPGRVLLTGSVKWME